MNKKIIFIILIILAVVFASSFYKKQTKELDLIKNYAITVSPTDNGNLDLVYDITWKVLDSQTQRSSYFCKDWNTKF